MNAPAALAYAIVVFIDVAERLRHVLQERIKGRTIAAGPKAMPPCKLTRDTKVTFERMFKAYRLIFL